MTSPHKQKRTPPPRSASSSAATLASAARPPDVAMAAAAAAAAAATSTPPVGGDRRSTRSSAGPPKRRRRSTTKEEDGEEDRVIHKATDTTKRRSELFEDKEAIATVPATVATTTTTGPSGLVSTSTNGIVRLHGRGLSNNKWDLTPVSLLLRTLGYMDNDTLMIMCLVCKQIRSLIWSGQGMENKLVRIFKLSASKENIDYYEYFDEDHHRVRCFISKMNRYFRNIRKTRILQGFRHWKVQDVEEFDDRAYDDDIDDDELERLTQNIRMTGIVSLDMSSPLPIVQCDSGILYRAISFMVPNLQQLDLSHTTDSSSILETFVVRCPRLEIIRWNYNDDNCGIDAIGNELDSLNSLKELYFDNCYFGFDCRYIDENGDFIDDNGDDDGDGDNGVTELQAMSDSNNYPNIFLFHKLNNNPLERISLRNARYKNFNNEIEHTVSQQILMKFVRNAPSTLVWFRSDLSAANIRILQSERPEIQFLN